MKCVFYNREFLVEGINLDGPLTGLNTPPIGDKFVLMQFGPRLHETLLPTGKRSANQFDRSQAEDSQILLIIRVKVRQMQSAQYRNVTRLIPKCVIR